MACEVAGQEIVCIWELGFCCVVMMDSANCGGFEAVRFFGSLSFTGHLISHIMNKSFWGSFLIFNSCYSSFSASCLLPIAFTFLKHT